LPDATPRRLSPNSRHSAPASSFVPSLPESPSPAGELCSIARLSREEGVSPPTIATNRLFIPFLPPKFLIPRKPAYNIGMQAGTFIRSASTLLLAICLLIAPLCSARCAVDSCLPPTAPAQPAGCHHHGASPQSESIAALSLSCQTSDSLLTTLPANTIRFLQPIARHISSAVFSPVSVPILASVSLHSGQFAPSPGQQPSPRLVTPLRL
jgi:hypothetical protein